MTPPAAMSMPRRTGRAQHKGRAALAVVVLGLWALAALESVIKFDPIASGVEQRTLKTFAQAWQDAVTDPRRAPAAISEAAGSQMGFRNALTRGHAELMVHGWGVSPTDKAYIGKDGWLFLADDHALASYRRNQPYSEAIARKAAGEFEGRRRFLADHGCQYLAVIVPEKTTVHPEHMPDDLPPMQGQPSRADQLIKELGRLNPDFPLLDLRPVLRDAARGGQTPLFLRLDSHWNDDGAFTAYEAIIRRLKEVWPALEPIDRRHLRPRIVEQGGDLANLIGALSLRESAIHFDIVPGDAANLAALLPSARLAKNNQPLDEFTPFQGLSFVSLTPSDEWTSSRLPRVVVVHDSYTLAMQPWLGRHFSFTRWIWHPLWTFPHEFIANAQPMLVVQIFTERTL